ncbi:MAG: Uroporphyrinogen-III C-methyltransferase [Candidatus Argoarchaeum ethanivorans]|uniref:Uroporphyrinogen-III C-methyltransferase n=1 Tax=Candidatus Argoarchaeum ethanivorans TaxID=2608793 RepID=A0A811T731_9EURY|nr:MAG: Uroporphyrinogen-III C-methyltransferase [Candidatus Argoarchaeum ethanivorans]
MKTVYFVGAGPGDAKLITVRGKELLEIADVVIYTGSLVNRELLEYTKGETVNSHGMKLDQIIDLMIGSALQGKTVVRLHSGDPSIYGAITEQIRELEQKGLNVAIIPGVSSLFAASAALKTQLTLKGVSEAVIITRPRGTTLEDDDLASLSEHSNMTMALFLGTDKIRDIMARIRMPSDTPVAVVYHASWKDEKIIRGTIKDIADKVEASEITKSAIIIIGNVVSPEEYVNSYLYSDNNPSFP